MQQIITYNFFKNLTDQDIYHSSEKLIEDLFGNTSSLQFYSGSSGSSCLYTSSQTLFDGTSGGTWNFLETASDGTSSVLKPIAQRFYLSSSAGADTTNYVDMFIALGYAPGATIDITSGSYSGSHEVYGNDVDEGDIVKVRYATYQELKNLVLNNPTGSTFLTLSYNGLADIGPLQTSSATAVLGVGVKRSNSEDSISPSTYRLELIGNVRYESGSANDITDMYFVNSESAIMTYSLIPDMRETPETSPSGLVYKLVSGSYSVSGATVYGTADSSSVYGRFYPSMGLSLIDIGFHYFEESGSGYDIWKWYPNTPFSAYLSGSTWCSESVVDELHIPSESVTWYSHPDGPGLVQNQCQYYEDYSDEHKFRLIGNSERHVLSSLYFCRMLNYEFNYSTNPTFVDSDGVILEDILENMAVYCTEVGFYNDSNDLLAIAKLGEPKKKSQELERTVIAKLKH